MPQPLKVLLLPQAQEDLDSILDPLFSRVAKRLKALRRYPGIGHAMAGPFAGYRATVVAPYRILYRSTPGAILVAYIRHCRRHS